MQTHVSMPSDYWFNKWIQNNNSIQNNMSCFIVFVGMYTYPNWKLQRNDISSNRNPIMATVTASNRQGSNANLLIVHFAFLKALAFKPRPDLNRITTKATFLSVKDQLLSMSLAMSIPFTFFRKNPRTSIPRRLGSLSFGMIRTRKPPRAEAAKRIERPKIFPPGKASLPTMDHTVAQATKATSERVKYLPRNAGMLHDWAASKQGKVRFLFSELDLCCTTSDERKIVWAPLEDKLRSRKFPSITAKSLWHAPWF